MSRKVALTLLFVVLFAFSYCATKITILNTGKKGEYKLVAITGEEVKVLNDSNEAANEYCDKSGKSFVLVDRKVEKKRFGISESEGNSEHLDTPEGIPFYSPDYKVTLIFKCE